MFVNVMACVYACVCVGILYVCMYVYPGWVRTYVYVYLHISYVGIHTVCVPSAV